VSTADEAFEATAALDLAADAGQQRSAGGGRRRIHPAWWVALVAFVALIGAAGFRAAPGVLMVPLEEEFGWPRTLISSAVSLNLVLYGLMAPFAAALMDRFGIRWVTSIALILVAAGSGLTIVITQAGS
jgi:MFS family permease